MEGDETLTLTEEKVSHPSTLELARLTSKCLPFPVLEKSRKSYTLPKKGMSKTSHKSRTIPELPLKEHSANRRNSTTRLTNSNTKKSQDGLLGLQFAECSFKVS